jgi:hypothetical protein
MKEASCDADAGRLISGPSIYPTPSQDRLADLALEPERIRQ